MARRGAATFLIICLWAIAVFPNLPVRSFIWEEGTNAEIARDILSNGNLLQPEVYGIRWNEKPSLLPWLIAGVAKVTGEVNEFSARLPAMIAVVLTALLVRSLTRRYASRDASLLAALFFMFSPMLLQKLAIAEPDTLVTLLSFAAFVLWWNGVEVGRIGIWRWIGCGLLLAILAMAKGPQPVGYFALGVFAYVVVTRRWRDIPGLFVCLSVPAMATVAWAAAVYQPGDEATWISYARLRSAPSLADYLVRNTQVFLNLVVELLPSILLAPLLMWCARQNKSGADVPPVALPLALYAGICTIAVVLWPGSSSRYAMPCVPALARRGLTIVRSYEDAGKSGLGIERRTALRELMQDVRSGSANFSTILVYDVSRWGRFQDADESAYYEFLCKEAGVTVAYCAEQFTNDGSLFSTLLKNIKRAMAGEFSRELSAKVFAGQCRSVSKGFYVGSSPGYGLRRLAVDDRGRARLMMNAGDRKAITTDRTILVPGPPPELAVIHDIYSMFLDQNCSINEIARTLNNRKIVNAAGREWKPVAIRDILANPKYMGTAVFARTARKLNSKSIRRPRSEWITCDGAFDALVPADSFREAQRQLIENARPYSEQEMLDSLTAIWCNNGRINASVVANDRHSPCVNTYKEHFGGLVPAYRKIGYFGRFQRGKAPQFRKSIVAHIAEEIAKRGGVVSHDRDCSQVCVNEELEIAVVAGCADPACGKNQWQIRRRALAKPDILVVVRVDDWTSEISGYIIVPLLVLPNEIWLSITKARFERMRVYRSNTLEPLFSLCKRTAMAAPA